jgi:MoaA/NifB/PqqE/SkfB family radical SAM enzyme
MYPDRPADGSSPSSWDVPVENLREKAARFSFKGDELVLKTSEEPRPFKPVWRSKLPLAGYVMIHLSLWEGRRRPPRQRAVLPSMHLFWNSGEVLPLDFAFISLTQRCNLSCPMCMRHSLEHWEADDVLTEVLESVVSACPDLHSVFLGGIGEPLLYGGLVGLVRTVKAKMPSAGQVGMNTNGMLMDGERAAPLLDAGLDWVCFSVDGAKRETVQKIRTGSDFDRLKANISATVRHREKSGRKGPWLASNFVVQEENVEEVVPFIELAASLGLDAVQVSHRRDFRKGEFLMLGEKMLGPVFAAAEAAGKQRGITVTLPALRPSGEFRCRFMQGAYILLDGEVVPCCRMLPGAYPGGTQSFGSTAARPLSEIWLSPGYRAFREGVLSGDTPAACRRCPYASGLLT